MPVGVGLVDDDKAQVGKKVGPQGVVGQDAEVEHVGVCEEDVGLAAQPGAGRLGCVAVVDAKAGGTQLIMGQLVQAAELVLGEGLGGEEVEGTSAPVGEECSSTGTL